MRVALMRQHGDGMRFWRSRRSVDRFNARALELLAAVGLDDQADTIAALLPYGRKRALEIAMTLALDPEIMLLDEPMAGLGQEDVARIAALIRRVSAKRSILMVEHNLSVVADLSDTITVLARGAVLARATTPPCRATSASSPPTWARKRRRTDAVHQQAQRLVRRIACAARRGHRGQARRAGHHPGPQRRRQDHHAARHHGHSGQAQRLDPPERPGNHRHGAAPHPAPGRGVLPEERAVFPA